MVHIKQVRIVKYLQAIKDLYSQKNLFHKRTGQRFLPIEKVEERFEICKTCDYFTGLKCELCGCCTDNRVHKHFTKLAYPTERCPADPPKWLEET